MDKKKLQVIIEALNTLALALTDYKHQWTAKERKLYERAMAILT